MAGGGRAARAAPSLPMPWLLLPLLLRLGRGRLSSPGHAPGLLHTRHAVLMLPCVPMPQPRHSEEVLGVPVSYTSGKGHTRGRHWDSCVGARAVGCEVPRGHLTGMGRQSKGELAPSPAVKVFVGQAVQLSSEDAAGMKE